MRVTQPGATPNYDGLGIRFECPVSARHHCMPWVSSWSMPSLWVNARAGLRSFPLGRLARNDEEAHFAIGTFIRRYDHEWLLERHGYMTPAEVRSQLTQLAA
ncbi:MAG: hypothetical protein M3P51_14110 [Chloroflexota bacterium]|nr:hypothetical protein [Chloroflexota bacterium]